MYGTYCAGCHGSRGNDGVAADLALAEVAPTLSDTELENFIRQGIEGTNMPGFDKTLDDGQIKALITHVRTLGEQ